jgi:hypothetical protein
MRKPRTQRIRAKTSLKNLKLSGWLAGRETYLRLETVDGKIDFIDGQTLYRLAKAVITRFEAEKKS